MTSLPCLQNVYYIHLLETVHQLNLAKVWQLMEKRSTFLYHHKVLVSLSGMTSHLICTKSIVHQNRLEFQVNRSGRDFSLGQRRVDGVQAAAQPLPQPRPRPTPPYWLQLAARGAAWRRDRALRSGQSRSGSFKRPNLLQLLLHPLNNFAASL